jgi:hypothetical protein
MKNLSHDSRYPERDLFRDRPNTKQKYKPLGRWQSSGIKRRVVSLKFIDVSEVCAVSIIRTIDLMIEAVRTSEK